MRLVKRSCTVITAIGFFAGAILPSAVAGQAVSPTMPQPSRTITAPAPQRPAPPQPQPAGQKPGARAPQPAMRTAGDGVILGYVWWDAQTVNHIPANNCSGLSITVSAGSPSQSTSAPEQFTPLGTYSNNFTYVPNVGRHGVCAFAVNQMPVGRDLRVKVDVVGPASFSPASAPAAAITSLQIINGKCNNLPPAVPSPSTLASNWWTCGNHAYNVNFALRPSSNLVGGGATGMISTPVAPQGMLSSTGPRGMLNGGATPSTAAMQAAPDAAGARSAIGKAPMVPQSTPAGPSLNNADVIKMFKNRVPESVILSSVRSSRGGFDLSPGGCSALRQGHVSEQVLSAMADGSVRPCAAETGPKQREQALTKSLTLKLGSNIRVASAARNASDPEVMNALRAQSIATHKERLAPPPSVAKARSANPAVVATNARTSQVLASPAVGAIGPSHTMGSGTDPATGGSGTDPTTGSSDPAGTPGGSQPGSTPDGSDPSQQSGNAPSGSGQGSLSLMQRAAKASQPISMCRFTTEPVIETVGGRQHAIVFTPDPGTGQYPNNQYTIRGCNFGALQGQVKIFGPFINNQTPVQLGIDSWNDAQIVVTFNPTFQNEYDLKNNLTLAVVRDDGHNAQITGISFSATRVSRPLTRVPQSLVKLPTTYLERNSYVSPVTSANLQPLGLKPPAQPASAVFWIYTPIWTSNAGDGYPPNRMSFGDSIDFSQLRAGFVLDPNIQTLVGSYVPDLSSQSGIGVDGGSCKYYDVVPSANMQGNNLLVGVQTAECDNGGKFIYAYYGLELSVTGPKGDLLDPWPSNLQ